MSAPINIAFSPTEATLAAILARHSLPQLAGRRSNAFSRLNASRGIPLLHPRWTSGERHLPTSALPASDDGPLTNDGRPRDELATLALSNAGGLVHFGGITLRPSQAPSLPPGVSLLPLAQALTEHPEALEPSLIQRIDRAKSQDALLAAAFLNCGVWISIAPDTTLTQALQLLWIYPGGQTQAVFPLIVVSVGAGSQAQIIERHLGAGEAFVCGMVDVHLAAQAQLDYVVIEQMAEGSHLRMARTGSAASHSRLGWHIADTGSASTHNLTTARSSGPHARIQHSSLALRSSTQRIEQGLRFEARHPAVSMRTVSSVALTDQSRARLHERLNITKLTARAKVTSQTHGLLLSRQADFESRPERSASSPDSMVTQSAHIGSIDAEAMFYLATRGIDHRTARKMIALGFFEPSILTFPSLTLQEEIRTNLDERIEEAVE